MTFQEAQAKFSAIVAGVSPHLSSAELVQKQRDLQALLAALPNTAEFDSIANAIGEFSPKLAGQVTQAVVESLRSRDASFKETSDLLTRVAASAEADARTLSFEQPKLVIAALNETIGTLKGLQADAQAGRFQDAASKVDTLITLAEQVRGSIRIT